MLQIKAPPPPKLVVQYQHTQEVILTLHMLSASFMELFSLKGSLTLPWFHCAFLLGRGSLSLALSSVIVSLRASIVGLRGRRPPG